MVSHADTTYSMVKLTQHYVPEAKTFNLLGTEEEQNVTLQPDIGSSSKKGKLLDTR